MIRRLCQIEWNDGELTYSTLLAIINQSPPGTEVICHGNIRSSFPEEEPLQTSKEVTIPDTW